MTNAASALSIEQATTVFVFILSAVLLAETVTWPKVIAVALTIGGVIMIAFGDASSEKSGTNLCL
jgi:drug/metabolite transporter (DMT)-like permease